MARGLVGSCPDAQLVRHFREVIEQSPFHGEGYRKPWALCCGRTGCRVPRATIPENRRTTSRESQDEEGVVRL